VKRWYVSYRDRMFDTQELLDAALDLHLPPGDRLGAHALTTGSEAVPATGACPLLADYQATRAGKNRRGEVDGKRLGRQD
jgi:hypothetical protein